MEEKKDRKRFGEEKKIIYLCTRKSGRVVKMAR